jgi:hypothetical protein
MAYIVNNGKTHRCTRTLVGNKVGIVPDIRFEATPTYLEIWSLDAGIIYLFPIPINHDNPRRSKSQRSIYTSTCELGYRVVIHMVNLYVTKVTITLPSNEFTPRRVY